jgi:hypothetical protein
MEDVNTGSKEIDEIDEALRTRPRASAIGFSQLATKTATDCAAVGPQLTNNKAHNVTTYDGMIMVGPLGPSARARVPCSFVAPRACPVGAFVRPRLRTAQSGRYLAIVDALLVARLAAQPLFGGFASARP